MRRALGASPHHAFIMETTPRAPRRLGFAALLAVALFCLNRGCSSVDASPSWLVSTAWFAAAVIVLIGVIWLWDHTARRHWIIKIISSVIVLAGIAASSYGPIRRQYRQEHPVPLAKQAEPMSNRPDASKETSSSGGGDSASKVHRSKPAVKPKPEVAPDSGKKSVSAATPSVPEKLSQTTPTIQINSAPNGIAISGGTVNNPTVINTGPPPAVPNPVVPEISITTQEGLAPSDFPNLIVSSEMMQHLRRHVLTVKNTNTIDLGDFVMRFQLPEPVFGDLRIEDRPAGIEITWHACRVAFALSGNGASTTPLPGGGTQITTGSTPGSTAVFRSNQEVCSEKMDNEKLRPTGIYELRIERLPAVTLIRLAFLTSNGREGQSYVMFSGFGDSDPTALSYFGDGRFQYSSGGHIETRDVLVPLHFDRGLRTIISSPSSGEHGKWKLTIAQMN